MRWFGWFRGSAYEGGALTNPDIGTQDTRPSPSRSASNIVVTDERAMMISTVYACTSLKANTCATLPLGFYERTSDGRKPLPETHYLIGLLKYSPNNFMNALEFRQAMFTQRVLWGNGYARVRWQGERPVSLVPLKPEFMTVERGTDGLVYNYNKETGTVHYAQRDILHLKGFGTDGITGLSPLGFARESLGLSVAADQSAAKSIGGRASAVLETDEFPTDAQTEKLRKLYGAGDVTDKFRSDGGLMITPGNLKYRAIGLPPDDLQLLESRQFQVPEICRYFGVPAVMVDGSTATTAAWPASYEQQMQSFLTFSLKPLLDEFECAVVNTLLPPTDRRKIFAEHKVTGLLRADSAGRSSFYSSALQNAWMTSNEVRKLENLPMSEDVNADVLRAQLNMAPISELGDSNEQT